MRRLPPALYVVVAGVAAAACIVLIVWLGLLDAELKTGRAPGPPTDGDAGNGIVDLEFAFTKERAAQILAGWPEKPEPGRSTLRPVAEKSVIIDFFFIAAYWLFFNALFALVRRTVREAATETPGLHPDYRWWGRHGWRARKQSLSRPMREMAAYHRWWEVSLTASGAAVCDIGENLLLLWTVRSDDVPGLVVGLAGLLASLKFALIAIAAIPLLVIAIVRGRRFLQKRLPGQVAPDLVAKADRVIEREREYLVERRKKLGPELCASYPPTELTGGTEPRQQAVDPIGVALSGGGIRSATLNLGALESLIRFGVMPKVDYLATVSGGGYIGSLLSSLLSINNRRYAESPDGGDEQYHFAPDDQPRFSTDEDRTPFETNQLDHLRTHGDFLILRRRLVHRDVLRFVATVLGGIFYQVLLFFAALTMAAGVYMGVAQWMAGPFEEIAAAIGSPIEQAGRTAVFQADVGAEGGEVPAGETAAPEAEPAGAAGEAGGAAVVSAGKYFELVFGGLGNPFDLDLGLEPGQPFWKNLWPGAKGLVVGIVPHLRSLHPFWKAVLGGIAILPLAMVIIGWILWGSSLPDRWFERGAQSVEEMREFHSLAALFWITLLAAATVTVHFVTSRGGRPSYLLLAMGIYTGGWLVSLVLHGVVSTFPIFDRNARSRFAAWKGMFHYLAVASVIVICAPLAILWLSTQQGFSPETGGLVWLAGLVATWLFSKNESEGTEQAKKLVKRIGALSASIRNFFLGLAVTVVIGGGLLFVCALIYEATVGADAPVAASFKTAAVAFMVIVFLGLVLDFNRLSAHYFYRDRLVETYLQTVGPPVGTGSSLHHDMDLRLVPRRDNAEMRIRDLHGSPEDNGGPAGVFDEYFGRLAGTGSGRVVDTSRPPSCQTSAPYHLVVTCLNLTQSRNLKRRNRKSDHFIFSKLYCGSNTTGYVDSRHYRSGATKLARAMTISGAAFTPSVGARTFFAQSFALALFNIRLGQWLENPSYRDGGRAHSRENLVFWPLYLIREMLGYTNAEERLVYLSDGGHTGDNVGVVPLLQRRCRLILAFDAECDRKLEFGSLNEAIRQASIDEGIEIDIDLAPIYCQGPGKSERHVAVGRITYPDRQRKGWLLVFKSSLTGDEPEPIKNYSRLHEAFPNQTTGDLFFDDAQFEAYRELGKHQAEQGLGKELVEALGAKGWTEEWSAEFGDLSSLDLSEFAFRAAVDRVSRERDRRRES